VGVGCVVWGVGCGVCVGGGGGESIQRMPARLRTVIHRYLLLDSDDITAATSLSDIAV